MENLSKAVLNNKMQNDKYDYETALKYNIQPDETGHWQSRVPSGEDEGLILKLEGHPTISKTFAKELQLGFSIYKKNDNNRLYSLKNNPGKGYTLIASPKMVLI